MARRKRMRRHKKTIADTLVETTTRIGDYELRLQISHAGDHFWVKADLILTADAQKLRRQKSRGIIIEEKTKSPDVTNLRLAARPIIWSWAMKALEADYLVYWLATELGYEVSDDDFPRRRGNFDPLAMTVEGGKIEIDFNVPGTGPSSGVVVSRSGATRIFKALAKELDWNITD